ncbi:ATP-binding protein, partial [Deinococcus arboris]
SGLLIEARPGQTMSDALVLFIGQARRVRPVYRFTDLDLEHAQAVCTFVDGLPLAVELTANWIRTLTPEAILGNVQAILGLPSAPMSDLPERHQSMRLVLEQSWERLTPREQEVLAALAVFHGGFTFAAAAAVVGATLQDLQGLVDTSMIRVDVTGRFSQHPLIAQLSRQYLSENLVAQRTLEEKHAAFFLKQSNTGFYEQLDGQRQMEWQDWFHSEYPNLAAALDSATARADYLSAMYLARNLHREWNNRGLAAVKLPTILSLLPYVKEEPAAHAWGLITAEAFAMYSGTQPVGDALAAARAAGDEYNIMCALYVREFAVQQRGDAEHAALMDELYAAVVKTGRPAPLATMLRRRASVVLAKGDGAAAQNDLESGLFLAKQMGATFNRADLHLLMGQVHTLRGQLDAAEQCFHAALHMFTTLGYRPHASTCFNALALLQLLQVSPGYRSSALQVALDYCDRADETFSSEGRLAVRDNVNARGFVLSALNRLPEAQECFERDVQAARNSGNRQGEHMARLGLGHLALRRRDWSAAQTIFAAIVAEADAADGHRPACWLALHGLADTHLRLGHQHRAQTHWDEAQRLGQRLGAVLPYFLTLPARRSQRQQLEAAKTHI